MKTKVISVFLLLISTTLILLFFFQSPVGPHDGIVKQVGEYNIEMKNCYPVFYTYLLNKNNSPVSNNGISCMANFVFPDNTSINVSLKPFEQEGFSMGSGTFNFLSCSLNFNVRGKTVIAQFENEIPIAEERE